MQRTKNERLLDGGGGTGAGAREDGKAMDGPASESCDFRSLWQGREELISRMKGVRDGPFHVRLDVGPRAVSPLRGE